MGKQQQVWIGIEGEQHSFVYGNNGVSRISACGRYPHPDLHNVSLERDTRNLPECEQCKSYIQEES